jgi:prepilin-type N-terminal cleavage/methylation domain-containing protein
MPRPAFANLEGWRHERKPEARATTLREYYWPAVSNKNDWHQALTITGPDFETVKTNRKSGMSLTELLCVIAIIAILASLYLGAIARAFVRIKKFLDGF